MTNSYIMNKNEACVTKCIVNVIPNIANSCIYEKYDFLSEKKIHKYINN